MEKYCNERPPELIGICTAARVEDEEDSNVVQTSDSLLTDSPVLLTTKEEYKDTLQGGRM